MILKFPKCFKLHRYNYLFPIDYNNFQEYRTYLINALDIHVNDYSRNIEYSYSFPDLIENFWNIYFKSINWDTYSIRVMYGQNGFIFNNILYFENQVIMYFDVENYKLIINNHLSDEQKDSIINLVYMKNANLYTYNIVCEYSDDLEIESIVTLKRIWDVDRTIGDRFITDYDSDVSRYLLAENNITTLYRIPVANLDLLHILTDFDGVIYCPPNINDVRSSVVNNISTLNSLIGNNEDNNDDDDEDDEDEDLFNEDDDEDLEEDLIEDRLNESILSPEERQEVENIRELASAVNTIHTSTTSDHTTYQYINLDLSTSALSI